MDSKPRIQAKLDFTLKFVDKIVVYIYTLNVKVFESKNKYFYTS